MHRLLSRSIDRRVMMLCMILLSSVANGQSRKSSEANVKELDVQAQQAREKFIRDLVDLSKSYEDAGDLDKSREMLRSILKLEPDLDAVKKKIAALKEKEFDGAGVTLEVAPEAGWTTQRVRVFKGEPFRIEATGTYRFVVSETLSPDGFPEGNPRDKMVDNVTPGALMGLIIPMQQVAPPRPAQKRPRNQPDESKLNAFKVGHRVEHTAKEDGFLTFRLNIPANSKSQGRIRVTITGHVEAESRR